jgi:hypothetical protein
MPRGGGLSGAFFPRGWRRRTFELIYRMGAAQSRRSFSSATMWIAQRASATASSIGVPLLVIIQYERKNVFFIVLMDGRDSLSPKSNTVLDLLIISKMWVKLFQEIFPRLPEHT